MIDLPLPRTAHSLTVKEVAEFVRAHPKTIRRWIAKGDLPATCIGRDWRIARVDLNAFMNAKGVRGLVNVLESGAFFRCRGKAGVNFGLKLTTVFSRKFPRAPPWAFLSHNASQTQI